MNKQDKIIITLLIGNLIISGFTIGYTKIKINELEHVNKQYLNATLEKIDDVYDEVRTIKENQQWISDAEIKDGGIVDGKQIVKLFWTLKDYTMGSEATLYYRKIDENEFKQKTLEPTANGSLMTNLEMETEIQPYWHIYSDDEDGYSDNAYIYEYYITLNNENRILTSDTKRMNFEKFNTYYYCPSVDISYNNDNIPSDIEINFNGEPYGKIVPKKAFIELFDNDKSTEEELILNGSLEKEFYATDWENDDKSFDKLVVKVQYSDGKEFEKEIWKK